MARRDDIERLMETIVEGKTDAALDLCKEIFGSAAPWPNHVKRLVADRRAQAPTRAA